MPLDPALFDQAPSTSQVPQPEASSSGRRFVWTLCNTYLTLTPQVLHKRTLQLRLLARAPAAERIWAAMIMMIRSVMMEENYQMLVVLQCT